jgi:dipeptidyl aminopeptidase/acylaminoacyl peptidase
LTLATASRGDELDAKPLHISIPIGRQDQQLYTLLYLPLSEPEAQAKRPPLILFFHGGPTACSYAVLQTRIQYWTQRGFAVADINYRGSAGYGRAYRLLLKYRWGVSDVEDANSVVDFLADRAYIDPRYVFVRGSSAGGFTALAALAANHRYCAGASLYGVTDPKVLAEQTHKFESYYLHWLIGDPERDAERYRDRAPIHTAAKISAPVIFFQGEKDAVVVPSQTREMVHLLSSQGLNVAAHYYADEAHGFRSAANLADALEKEHQFYRSVMDEMSGD